MHLVGGERREVTVKCLAGRLVEWNQNLPTALALGGHHLIVDAQHVAREPKQLRDAQARGVERFEQRVEAERTAPGRALASLFHAVCRGREERFDFGERQQFRQRASKLRTFDRRAWIIGAYALREEEAEELADGGKLPGSRRSHKPLAA